MKKYKALDKIAICSTEAARIVLVLNNTTTFLSFNSFSVKQLNMPDNESLGFQTKF